VCLDGGAQVVVNGGGLSFLGRSGGSGLAGPAPRFSFFVLYLDRRVSQGGPDPRSLSRLARTMGSVLNAQCLCMEGEILDEECFLQCLGRDGGRKSLNHHSVSVACTTQVQCRTGPSFALHTSHAAKIIAPPGHSIITPTARRHPPRLYSSMHARSQPVAPGSWRSGPDA
jgi:hypothetical protein